MRAVPGLLAKDGAEGVQVAALPDGTSLAVKISDGGNRARLPITLAILELAGVDPVLLQPLQLPWAVPITGSRASGWPHSSRA